MRQSKSGDGFVVKLLATGGEQDVQPQDLKPAGQSAQKAVKLAAAARLTNTAIGETGIDAAQILSKLVSSSSLLEMPASDLAAAATAIEDPALLEEVNINMSGAASPSLADQEEKA